MDQSRSLTYTHGSVKKDSSVTTLVTEQSTHNTDNVTDCDRLGGHNLTWNINICAYLHIFAYFIINKDVHLYTH